MCECRKKMEEALLEKVVNDRPDAQGLKGSLSGYALILKGNTLTERPVTTFDVEYTHTYKNGKTKLKKEKINVALSHCPHCGEKVE